MRIFNKLFGNFWHVVVIYNPECNSLHSNFKTLISMRNFKYSFLQALIFRATTVPWPLNWKIRFATSNDL